MKGKIERAVAADMREIFELQHRAFLPVARIMRKADIPPLVQTEEEALADFSTHAVLKYTEGGRIVGSVRGRISENGECYVGKLMVDPSCQNRGIGRALMSAVEEEFPAAPKFVLITGEETPNTAHLYRRVGYVETGRRTIGGVPMICMEKYNSR